jgi:uncharacterized protein (TIGR00266 family)
MRTEIKFSPAFAAATVHLSGGETIQAESGAMLAMSGVEISTSIRGGLIKGLRRAIVGDESFFMNTFTAGPAGGQVTFAPDLPGDIVEWQLSGPPVLVQSGSFLACSSTVDVDTKWGGARTFFAGEGLFMLKCTGSGHLLVSSFGAIETVDLGHGQTITVDTGHLVGWTDDLKYSVRKVGNWKSTVLSGEGLVCDLTGPGRVYLQSRSQRAFLDWLIPQLPVKSEQA